MRETAERSARVFSSRQRSWARARVARRASLHETLETRALLSVNAGDDEALAQLAAVHPQSHSCGCAGCTVPPPPADYRAASMYQAAASPFPLGDTFKLHSLPTATKRIYLDFDGHVTQNTYWNTRYGRATIDTPAFSLDSDYAAFSDTEKAAIQEIWARVVEDFAPFEVDVTTEDPGNDALINSGSGDTAWGIRVVVGGDGGWAGSAGIAVMDGFGKSDGSPAFAFADQWWKINPNITTICISHEVGHTLGLSHDGPGYYGGHGTGPTSWGPIMGNGDKGLTHWSNGDYRNANNKEDDLAIITTQNGFGYRADDHGDTSAAATTVAGTTAKGIIERNTDVDLFRLTSSGTIRATIKPAEFGANLDILAEILDSSGAVIHTSNPIGAIDASFNVTVSAGTYYLRVQGTGEGDPLGTGYSKYGSLGQYTVTLGGAEPPPPPPGSVTLSVGDITIAEGNAGTSQATLTFTLSAAAASAVTVQYMTVDGTATTADDDYTAATGTVTLAAGETQKTVSLAIKGDTKSEPNENFTVALSNPVGATLTRQAATVTITNDDETPPPPPPGVPTVSIADVSVAEGNAATTAATLTLTLSAAASTAVTVRYSTADGTATSADNDYIAVTVGSVTFAPGETQKTIALTVRGDTKVEPDERFVVRLSNPQGATLARGEATVTITNDDASTPPGSRSLSVNDVTVSEGHAGTTIAEFTVSLSAAAPTPVTVWFKTADATATTADRDYLATSGSLTFLPGETSKPVRVAVSGDVKAEANESFALVLSSPRNATIARGRGTATIANDDTARITASIGDASIREGNSGERVISFVVTLSAAPRDPVTMTVRTVDGTATSGADYTPLSRTITFGRGMVRQTVSVWVRGDTAFEPDETFSVELGNLVGATVGRGTAQGTILNDDRAPATNLVQMAAWAQISQAERPSAAKSPLYRAL